MKQSSHSWIAIRAAALLGEDADCKGLVNILTPSVKAAAIGAWMPDLEDSKLGSGDTDNHVFKMEPYSGELESRFVTSKADLQKRLGVGRRMVALISEDKTLDESWWGTPYKASPGPDQNIANRVQALSTTLKDSLILANKDVAKNIARKFKLSEQLTDEERTRPEQVSLYFFMLSHFIADACMPCHCDKRYLASYTGHFHPEWEAVMSKPLDTLFTATKLSQSARSSDEILEAACANDEALGVKFDKPVPVIKDNDVWKETVAICRASYAINNILASPKEFPVDSRKTLSVKNFDIDPASSALFKSCTSAALHDAVLNTATIWKHISKSFTAR